jgi:hypothetical protein
MLVVGHARVLGLGGLAADCGCRLCSLALVVEGMAGGMT